MPSEKARLPKTGERPRWPALGHILADKRERALRDGECGMASPRIGKNRHVFCSLSLRPKFGEGRSASVELRRRRTCAHFLKEKPMRQWISYVASLALVLTIAVVPALAQQKKGQAKTDIKVRGKITKVEGTDRVVVRTKENKDVILVTNPQTRFTINGKAGRFADLRVGTEIDVVYLVRDDVNVVNTVLVGELDTAAADATLVEGTIVR